MSVLASDPLQQVFWVANRLQRLAVGYGNVPANQQVLATVVVLKANDAFTQQVSESTHCVDLCSVNLDSAVSEGVAVNIVNARVAVRIHIDN